jgi:hypothetical protein
VHTRIPGIQLARGAEREVARCDAGEQRREQADVVEEVPDPPDQHEEDDRREKQRNSDVVAETDLHDALATLLEAITI